MFLIINGKELPILNQSGVSIAGAHGIAKNILFITTPYIYIQVLTGFTPQIEIS